MPANAPSQNTQIVKDSYDHLARFWTEVLFARRLCRESDWRNRVSISDEALVRQYRNQNRGCIIASALAGNPVMCAFTIGQLLGKVHVLIDLDASPVLKGWNKVLHGIPGVELVPSNKASQCLPGILDKGGAVWMIAESERQHGYAVRTSFLGRSLRAYPTIARLARYYEVPIMTAMCTRRGGTPGEFSFDLDIKPLSQTGEYLDDAETTRQILRVLEKLILAHPEQYLWTVPDNHVPSVPKHVQERSGTSAIVATS
jgi:KDO2-lipid IV(A) lauroyltransferase